MDWDWDSLRLRILARLHHVEEAAEEHDLEAATDTAIDYLKANMNLIGMSLAGIRAATFPANSELLHQPQIPMPHAEYLPVQSLFAFFFFFVLESLFLLFLSFCVGSRTRLMRHCRSCLGTFFLPRMEPR